MSDCSVICHGCNCFHTMGSGIALAIKRKYPEAYMADMKQTTLGDPNKLGTFSKADCGDKLIYNLYQQFRYGRDKMHLQYDALEQALIAMKSDLQVNDRYKISKIGMPRIGCSLAGGDWNVVKQIIERVFSEKDVYVYSL